MPPVEPIESSRSAVVEVFEDLAARTDDFEAYAHPHASRVAAIANQLARSFHLGARDRLSLRIAAPAHALGELAMTRDYLHRHGKLSEDQRGDLARHPLLREREAAAA